MHRYRAYVAVWRDRRIKVIGVQFLFHTRRINHPLVTNERKVILQVESV